MLRIVTGSYHPDLEAALVEEVRSLKSADPFAPLAIVVPSDPLQRRLKHLFCVERRLALLDAHILTFHQLALRLAGERRMAPGGDGGAPGPDVVSDLFFERLLSGIARRKLTGLQGLDLANLPAGGWSALWTAVRDLKDAMVDPVAAMRAAAEGLFDPHETAKLQGLFTLHAAVQESGRALGIGSADDVTVSVLSWAPSSPWLAGLARVCYYGFYDLTQVQLSLLEAIARSREATLYFPLGDGPAFAFARRFFERHIEPLLGAAPVATPSPQGGKPPQVRIMNAAGPDAELAAACKEILTLVETNDYAFDEIGVVARTLEPYRPSMKRVFDQHRIPFVTTAAAPLLEHPAAKAVAQLAALPLTDFFRAPVLDVLASPFYRLPPAKGPGTISGTTKVPDAVFSVEPRPDLWRPVVRALGITRGEEEWRRLASTGPLQTRQGAGGEDDETAGWNGTDVEASQVGLLWRLVSRLIEDCRRLPKRGAIGELTDAFLALAREHLTISGLDDEAEDDIEPDSAACRVGQAIGRTLREVRQLDRLDETVGWDEWAGLFAQAMERAVLPIEPFTHSGVQVLDAMAARGVPFRALILLGLNEAVFPRVIREDAFLRDRARKVLGETLGYKIDEKLGGYEEERLLFELLVRSAGDRLYLSYQRADAEGRPLAASSCLDPWLRARDGEARVPDVVVPRRLSDRLARPLFAAPLLTREELSVGLVLRDHDPSALLDATARDALLFRHGVDALQEMEGTASGLGSYDGLTGPLDRHWASIAAKGLAPTRLEQYARCPFQYFSEQVLDLEPVREQPEAEVPPRAMGDLCHLVLSRCYRQWRARGWPQQELPGSRLQADIREVTEEVFAEYAREHGAGYPLLWQMARQTVAGLVLAAAQADEADSRASGFVPEAFEVDAGGPLEPVGGSELKGLRVRGRLDRVDRREQPPGLRIVDYKYRHGARKKDGDKNLVLAAARGAHLQPPLYALMQPSASPAGEALSVSSVDFVFLAPRGKKTVERASFDPAVLTGEAGKAIARTVRTLVGGIKQGQYFVLPEDTHCSRCEFTAACRRLHGPTWWRAYLAPQAKQLRQIRKQKVDRDSDQ
jgi:ATP-dependent helicase/nuclease subunit B